MSSKLCKLCNITKPIKDAFKGKREICEDCYKTATRPCEKCNKMTEPKDFSNLKECKPCVNEYARLKRIKDKETVVHSDSKMIECNSCHIVKPQTKYRVGRRKCMDCNRKEGPNR